MYKICLPQMVLFLSNMVSFISFSIPVILDFSYLYDFALGLPLPNVLDVYLLITALTGI